VNWENGFAAKNEPERLELMSRSNAGSLSRFNLASLRSASIYILLAILNLFILVPQARYDPDPHHDGVMFAGAVAVAEGKVPNRDVFAQYGPLAPILHGQILKTFGIQLLNLRLVTALLLTLTALIVFALLRHQVGFKIAFLLQLLWVVSHPKLPLPPLMPWASVICTLLLLIAWLCWRTASRLDLKSYKILFLYFSSGLAISLGIFVRIQMLAFVLVMIIIILYKLLTRNTLPLQSMNFVLGCFVAVLGFLFWMSKNGSLADFIEQCITWPQEFYGRTYLPTTVFTKDGFIYWSTWYYYPLFFALVSLLIHLTKKYKGEFGLRNTPQSFSLWFTATILAIALSLLGTFDVQPKSYLNPILQLQWFIEKIPLSFFYFLATFGFIKVVATFLPGRKSYGFFEITIVAAAIAQLYPGNDPIHLWWIAPILLVAVVPDFYRRWINSGNLKAVFSYLLIFSILISTVNLIQLHSKERVTYSKDTVLSGMQASADEVTFVGRSLELLSQVSSSGQVLFDCADGLYATSGGAYLAADKYFVNWGPERKPMERSASIVFICRRSYNEILVKYPPNRFEVVHKIASLSGRENYILKARVP
jgi:hypothetical protein